jgi:hypothetical protein
MAVFSKNATSSSLRLSFAERLSSNSPVTEGADQWARTAVMVGKLFE